MKKYRTKIEITSEATNKDEAMEIVGDYLSGNIFSGIEMKCVTKPVCFYNQTTAKTILVILLVALGFVSGIKINPTSNFTGTTCQMAAVQPPLKTSDAGKHISAFKKAWEAKQSRQVLDYIKK